MMAVTTGLPGAGKTLWTIWHVEQLRKKEGREVYYHGIKDLALPWKPLDDPKKWFDCPPGSIIVIDEAQHHFPMRASAQSVPEHVARTATHRHHGFDIFLITQHPGKLDPAMRKDIEVHRHLMRKFGSRFATIHQWQGVRETCDKTRRDSIATTWRYPKEVFSWYKSAEVHTHKLSIPPKVIFAVIVIAIVGVGWFNWIQRMGRQAAGGLDANQPASASARPMASAAPGGASGPQAQRVALKTAQEYVMERVPRVAGIAHTAPVYDGLTGPKHVPRPAACLVSASAGCKCFTQQGTPYITTDSICRQIVAHGIFMEFDDPAKDVQQPARPAASDDAAPGALQLTSGAADGEVIGQMRAQSR